MANEFLHTGSMKSGVEGHGADVVSNIASYGSIEVQWGESAPRILLVEQCDETVRAQALGTVSVVDYTVRRDAVVISFHETHSHVLVARDTQHPAVPLALILSPDGGVGMASVIGPGQSTPSVKFADIVARGTNILPWSEEIASARCLFNWARWGRDEDEQRLDSNEWLALPILL